MENSYGIGIANRYALFLDDKCDPLEMLSLKEHEKRSKKKTKVAENENKTEQPVKTKTNVQKKTNKEINQKAIDNKDSDSVNPIPISDSKEEHNFNKNINKDRENKKNRTGHFENRNRDIDEQGERKDDPVLGNKTVGPKGFRRTFDDGRGKREFDKHPQKNVIEDNENAPNREEGENIEGNQQETPSIEEEPKELTLDEWKAQRADRCKPIYNIRKAGEGVDPSNWKKMYELRKKDNEQIESEDEEYVAIEYPQRVGRQTHIFDIDIQFNDTRRKGGDRGRGRRSGPRGGNRGNSRNEAGGRRYYNDVQINDRTNNRRAPKVDDERDFPSLY